MKKRYSYHRLLKIAPFMFFCLCITAWNGCKKDLNLVSEDNVTDATFWKTGSEFKLATNNLYNGLNGFGAEDTESDIAFNNHVSG